MTVARDVRRAAGLVLVIAGVTAAVISVLGLAFSWGSTKASPVTAVAASRTPTVPATVSPTSADTVAGWQTLLDPLLSAIASRDTSYLFDHLDPAVFQVYSADQCRAALAQPAPDSTLRFSVLSVNGPAPWPYAAGGQTITVGAVYTVDANVTSRGQTSRETHHFTLHNGQLGWFTQCTTTG